MLPDAATSPEMDGGTPVVSLEDEVVNPFGNIVTPAWELDGEVEDVVEVGGFTSEEKLVTIFELVPANPCSSSQHSIKEMRTVRRGCTQWLRIAGDVCGCDDRHAS